jgi:hypothetical protein
MEKKSLGWGFWRRVRTEITEKIQDCSHIHLGFAVWVFWMGCDSYGSSSKHSGIIQCGKRRVKFKIKPLKKVTNCCDSSQTPPETRGRLDR